MNRVSFPLLIFPRTKKFKQQHKKKLTETVMACDLRSQLKQYKLYHSQKTNVLIHIVFVPAILFSAICIGHRISLGRGITLAHALTTIYSLYYMSLCLLPGMLASSLLAILIWSLDSGKLHLQNYQEILLFVVGWIVQFIGHGFFEHRRPALMDNFIQSLITAPYFILFEILFKLGFYKELHAHLEEDVMVELSK